VIPQVGESSGEGSAAETSLAELELHLLLDGIYRLSGYDFHGYAPTLLRRRIAERVRSEGCTSTTGLLERALHDPHVLERLLYTLTSTGGTVPFCESILLADFARYVIPRLRTYPFFRIWVAGSGNRFDAYGLAILLREAQLLDRARIYATEATKTAIDECRRASVSYDTLTQAEEGYRQAGGSASLGDYLIEDHEGLHFMPELQNKMHFARHDLAAEGSFNEFEAVFVHSALGLYNRSLGYRAHQTIYESIARFGFFCIGSKDVLGASPHRHAYEAIAESGRIVQRVR
jgi:chemotaxis protein methyltransferase CheR